MGDQNRGRAISGFTRFEAFDNGASHGGLGKQKEKQELNQLIINGGVSYGFFSISKNSQPREATTILLLHLHVGSIMRVVMVAATLLIETGHMQHEILPVGTRT